MCRLRSPDGYCCTQLRCCTPPRTCTEALPFGSGDGRICRPKVWRLPDDGAVSYNAEALRASSIQVAAIGALVFCVLVLLLLVMQGSGPTSSSAADLAA